MSPEQAAIRRATRQAWAAVKSLDAAGRRELARAYREAAEDVRRIIAGHAGADDSVALTELRSVLAQIEARLAALERLRNGLLDEGLAKAADYGARVFEGGVRSSAAQVVSEGALRAVQAFVAADGLQLSDRLWRIDRGAREAVTRAVERAVIEGQSALAAAREFLARGEAVPAEIARKQGAANAARIGREADGALTGQGNALDNAMRVFRTEINRAHGTAYMMGGEDKPFFGGWRFLLSPAHPEADICDLLAAQNLHGLGAGVYPSREKCPWPAHPNTLSFVEMVFKDEITAADRAGKETSMEALARLDPATRRGVLGANKAEAFDDGRLTTGMIRAPWRSVQQRVAQARGRAPAWQWDEAKRARNLAKHGLDFAAAPAMFRGRTLTVRNPPVPAGERRWRTYGELNGVVLVAVYTERAGETRLISLRKVGKRDRERFRKQAK